MYATQGKRRIQCKKGHFYEQKQRKDKFSVFRNVLQTPKYQAQTKEIKKSKVVKYSDRNTERWYPKYR